MLAIISTEESSAVKEYARLDMPTCAHTIVDSRERGARLDHEKHMYSLSTLLGRWLGL